MSVRDSAIFDALDQVTREIGLVGESLQIAQPDDTDYLTSVLSLGALSSLLKVHDVLTATTPATRPRAYDADALRILREVSDALYPVATGTGSRRSSAQPEVAAAANDLLEILRKSNISGVLEAHDAIAAGKYGLKDITSSDRSTSGITDIASQAAAVTAVNVSGQSARGTGTLFFPPKEQPVQMVSIRRGSPDERLGLTVKREQGQLLVARIIAGSLVHKQGILQVGDAIMELNGRPVETPSQLEALVREAAASGSDLLFKVAPGDRSSSNTLNPRATNGKPLDQSLTDGSSPQLAAGNAFVRAHFTYSPARDHLLPCQTVGLEFRDGDILEILNKSDSNWWQARKLGEPENVGVVPSQQLEERRKAWVKPEWDMTKSSWLCGLATRRRKKKLMFVVRRNADLEPTDIPIYEEVACLPPFHRKLLVLVGASGVGKRTLKNRLVEAQHQRFALALPSTSRPPEPDEVRDPNSPDAEFRFTTRQDMEADIVQNKYAEWGEYRGHLYGVSLDSIRTVIDSSKTCVVDLNPQALKAVRTAEFLPYVVFVAAPSAEILRNMHEQARLDGSTDRERTEDDFYRTVQESAKLERQYRQYFDDVIINDNMAAAFDRLLDIVDSLSTKPQWVPIQWIY